MDIAVDNPSAHPAGFSVIAPDQPARLWEMALDTVFETLSWETNPRLWQIGALVYLAIYAAGTAACIVAPSFIRHLSRRSIFRSKRFGNMTFGAIFAFAMLPMLPGAEFLLRDLSGSETFTLWNLPEEDVLRLLRVFSLMAMSIGMIVFVIRPLLSQVFQQLASVRSSQAAASAYAKSLTSLSPGIARYFDIAALITVILGSAVVLTIENRLLFGVPIETVFAGHMSGPTLLGLTKYQILRAIKIVILTVVVVLIGALIIRPALKWSQDQGYVSSAWAKRTISIIGWVTGFIFLVQVAWYVFRIVTL